MLPNNSEVSSVGRYRWVVAFLLFLAKAINYVDRSALSIVAPTVSNHLELKQMSLLTVIPWVCGAVGMFGGGLLSDLLFRLTGNSPLSRKVVLVGGLALAALCVVLASQAASITTAVTLIACANLFLLMAPQNCWVLVQEMVPLNRVGMVGGFVQFLANTAGIFGPALTGFIVQYGGGYGASFVLAGVLAVAGALAVLVVVPTRRASTLKLAQ